MKAHTYCLFEQGALVRYHSVLTGGILFIGGTGEWCYLWGAQQKWKEFERNINTLYAQWEKHQQFEKAQKEYVVVQENIDVFPTPMMVEPVSIMDAAVSATGIKQI